MTASGLPFAVDANADVASYTCRVFVYKRVIRVRALRRDRRGGVKRTGTSIREFQRFEQSVHLLSLFPISNENFLGYGCVDRSAKGYCSSSKGEENSGVHSLGFSLFISVVKRKGIQAPGLLQE